MPPKSVYWEYFEKINNTEARCRTCSKVLKTCGNTTNLRLHVEKLHISLLKKHKSTTEDGNIRTKKTRGIDDNNTFKEPSANAPQPSSSSSSSRQQIDIPDTLNDDSESDSSVRSDISSASTLKKSFQPTLNSTFRNITEYAENGSKGVRLSNAILYMICKDSQPFQIVENEGFLDLMKVAAPLYKVPSRHTFKRMLDRRYPVTQNLFKNKIGALSSVTLTTDIWTDTMQTRSFLGITIHFYDEDNMETATLGVYELTQSHTAEYIAEVLLLTCNEWAIDKSKVMAVVTDGGSNMVKAIDIAFGKKCHILCFAHLLNRVAEIAMEKTEQLQRLITSAKRIITWFKNCVKASDELREKSDLKLIQDVSTRWNSTFYMAERFLKLRPVVNQIVHCHTSAPQMLTAKDMEDLSEICEVLRPLESATREACGEKYITSSKIIPLTRMLHMKITSLQPKNVIGENLKQNILNEIKKRLLQSEHVHILAVATLLDPRFKNIHFQDPVACSKAIKNVKDLLNIAEAQLSEEEQPEDEIQNKDSEADLWSNHYKLVQEKNCLPSQSDMDTGMPSELSYYLKNPLSDLKQDPTQVWNNVIGATYPKLKTIALRYLSVVATSTPSERLFSKAGSTLYQQRNRLTGKRLSQLLFMQSIKKKYWNL